MGQLGIGFIFLQRDRPNLVGLRTRNVLRGKIRFVAVSIEGRHPVLPDGLYAVFLDIRIFRN